MTEASGLVVSATQRGILWTHNDSGDGPFLYAFDEKGTPLATVHMPNAEARDWEDLASGPFPGKPGRWLYIADIGDNAVERTDACVYAIPEPPIARSDKTHPLESKSAIRLGVRYPNGPHNADCLLCDPRDGRLTIVTKEPGGLSEVFRFPKPLQADNLLEKIGTFKVPGESKRITLCLVGAVAHDPRRVLSADRDRRSCGRNPCSGTP